MAYVSRLISGPLDNYQSGILALLLDSIGLAPDHSQLLRLRLVLLDELQQRGGGLVLEDVQRLLQGRDLRLAAGGTLLEGPQEALRKD